MNKQIRILSISTLALLALAECNKADGTQFTKVSMDLRVLKQSIVSKRNNLY